MSDPPMTPRPQTSRSGGTDFRQPTRLASPTVYEVAPTPGGDGARLPAGLAPPAAEAPGGELARVASMLPALVAQDYDRPVTSREVVAVLSRLSMETGWSATAERQAAIAGALVRAGYTRAAVELAGRDLALDAALTKRLAFPEGTVTPADFRRMIDGEGRAAARTGLLSYRQALARFEEIGGMTGTARFDFADAFAVVRLDGETKPFFREL